LTTLLFIDANVLIYATGWPNPRREPCRSILGLVAEQSERFVTSAAVLQELLHLSFTPRLWPGGRDAVREFATLMAGRIEAIFAMDALAAIALADQLPSISARDYLLVAVMHRVGATHVISADRGFDRVSDVVRLDPADLDAWRSQFFV
jgi:predicted nucleic acid-binding protein